MPSNICREFARILGSKIMSSTNTSCLVSRMRNINAAILGRPSESALTLAAMFSFESPDEDGNTLNLGETVILPREINPFIDALRAGGIIVTALHNHWQFEKPRLMFIHWESVEDPIAFAEKTACAFQVLTGRIDAEPPGI